MTVDLISCLENHPEVFTRPQLWLTLGESIWLGESILLYKTKLVKAFGYIKRNWLVSLLPVTICAFGLFIGKRVVVHMQYVIYYDKYDHRLYHTVYNFLR